MARTTHSVCRLCRREKTKLMLKGDRCLSARCAITKKRDIPGPKNRRMKQLSEFGVQLREKQKVKRVYGVLERQFRNMYREATRRKGITGEDLLKMLEMRLDNVVYRLGLAKSRAQARQFVTHGHILINGKKVSIPSRQVLIDDVIEYHAKSKDRPVMKELAENVKTEYLSPWLSYDAATQKGKVIAFPRREHIDFPVTEQLIIELYSK
ncbi:MAG: 30S ribosomal protein S4 [Spirochaetota bacterium]